MKKKIFALISALSMFIAVFPSAYADINYTSYIGKYLSAGATSSYYGELNVLTCTNENISVDFKFIKNNTQQLTYTCYEGSVDNDKATVPFTVSYTDSGQFVTNGTMTITFTDWCLEISCDSPKQHLFDGTMKPQFVLNPDGVNSNNILDDPTVNTSSDVSVVLNGEKVTFPDGIGPIIINSSTYVPLRSVLNKMGVNVYWDQYKKNDILDAQSITCTKNNIIVQFVRTFNSSGANVWTLNKWVDANTNSQSFTRINITDLQPTIIGNSSYIPLRVVSEAFGADVGWVDEDRLVEINCDTANSYQYDTELIGKIEDFSQETALTYITSDFKDVIPDTTPYFSPQAKFYKFSATDTWGPVELHVFYGGFVEVYPVTVEEEQNSVAEIIPDEIPTLEEDDVTTEDTTTEDIITEDIIIEDTNDAEK